MGRTRSVVLTGLAGHVIDIEAHMGSGLPAFTMVGLPDAALHEARDRVRAAVTSSAMEWPNRRITVNLTPASLPKSGAVTDVAVAVAVLAASGAISPVHAAAAVHLGELGLDGRVRPVRGVLPAVMAAANAGYDRCVVPVGNAEEAKLVEGIEIHPVSSLAELATHYGNTAARPSEAQPVLQVAPAAPFQTDVDMADIRGQGQARWALEVAAAGGHHVLMVGPPGTGKTMLASRLPTILPDLTPRMALEATSVHSLAGSFDPRGGLLRRPPFEAPHHSASAASVVGGGSLMARPGAISRAHGGVLFLDEAPEFPARVLQTLRQPIEEGEVVLHRAHGAARYPARFQLVLAANPCPCGYYYDDGARCVCSHMTRRRYWSRLSGPLLDRIDVRVQVLREPRTAVEDGESSATVAARVLEARERARQRLEDTGWETNAQVNGRWLREHTPAVAMLPTGDALDRGLLSARGVDRVLRLAWTLADVEGREVPSAENVSAAMTLRGSAL